MIDFFINILKSLNERQRNKATIRLIPWAHIETHILGLKPGLKSKTQKQDSCPGAFMNFLFFTPLKNRGVRIGLKNSANSSNHPLNIRQATIRLLRESNTIG